MDDTKLVELIHNFRNGSVDIQTVRRIIDEYQKYPLYIIKYITVYYPTHTADVVINNIVKTNNRNYELMDCIMDSYNVKLCDISFMNNFVCQNKCLCLSRLCWKYMYDRFMEVLVRDPDYFLSSRNVYSALTTLISKTDIQDDKLFYFIASIVKHPQYWSKIIKFIGDNELFGSNYGDTIFNIRDLILENEKKTIETQNKHISNFRDKPILGSLLRKYNEVQKNMTCVTNNIYLSDINGVRNISLLRDKKIQYVVTLTKKQIFHANDINYIQIPIDDIGTVDFIEMTINVVDEVIKYINEKKIILVHCYKGLSRSVCFVMLVLIKQGLSFQDAYNLIKKKRNCIDPNPDFLQQILEYIKNKKI